VVEQPQEPEQTQSEETESETPPAEPQAPARRARLGQASGPAQYLGTGKRKTSVARVILRPGDGTTWFNGRTIEDYFPRLAHRAAALAPLKTAGVEGTYDIRVRVHGGGPTGQAGAVRHGIARALVDADPNLRVPLKREGYLTRDAREVERKKAGLHKARKAPQFSKR
jgi:small subunit ribosomal protein S9